MDSRERQKPADGITDERIETHFQGKLRYQYPYPFRQKTDQDQKADQEQGEIIFGFGDHVRGLDDEPLKRCQHDSQQDQDAAEVIYKCRKPAILVNEDDGERTFRPDP